MSDDLMQAYARLSAHEFLLEVMYANWFAHMTEDNSKEIAADLRRLVRSAYAAPDAKAEAVEEYGLQLARDSTEMNDRFLRKVEAREADIRAKLALRQRRQ